MNKENINMLQLLGHEIAKELDQVDFIGIQHGYGSITDNCAFNCLVTGSTFLTNSLEEAQIKVNDLRKIAHSS